MDREGAKLIDCRSGGLLVATDRLRRLQGHLRDHNWVAAAVDLAIVVIGVFLGIEAANWNSDRKERVEERRYYAQIIEDLRADQETLKDTEKVSRLNDRAAELSLQALATGIPNGTSPGHLAMQFQHAGFLKLHWPEKRTYDELISTGNIGLLRDQRAKSDLANYYGQFNELRQWDELLREQQGRYWDATAGVLPRLVLQAGIRNRDPELTAPQMNDILAEARGRPAIHDMLISMAAHQERVRRDSEYMAESGRALIKELQPLASP